MYRWILLWAAVTSLGCATTPPHTVGSPHGLARGFNLQAARAFADALDVAPAVRELLQSQRDEPVEVWAVSTRRSARSAYGTTYPHRIDMGCDALDSPRFYLAHELAHWYARDSPFAGLPAFLEEGLADWVAQAVLGKPDARHLQTWSMGSISIPSEDLFASRRNWRDLSLERSDAAMRLGYEVVRELGLETIAEMAASGAGPLDYVNAAAEGTTLSVSITSPDSSEPVEGGSPEDP